MLDSDPEQRPSVRFDTAWLIVRIVIAGLFLFSGFSKLFRPIEYFETAIDMYQIVPLAFISLVARTVPWFEICLGSYLLLGLWTRYAAWLLAGLSCVFQLILAQSLIRGLGVKECGCFGGDIHLSLFQSFTLDTVLVLALLTLAQRSGYAFSLDNWLAGRAP